MLMPNAVRVLSILAAFMFMAPPTLTAQTGSLQGEALTDWAAMKDRIIKIADAMPEDTFDYRSTPEQRTYGEQILHIAGANVGFLGTLGGQAPAPTMSREATAKAEILQALADSFDYGTALIEEQTDETMVGVVDARFFGESTRARVISFLLGHTWDVYGQMAVYLRLNGIVPPASQTP